MVQLTSTTMDEGRLTDDRGAWSWRKHPVVVPVLQIDVGTGNNGRFVVGKTSRKGGWQ